MRAIVLAAMVSVALAGCYRKVETADGKTVVTTAGVKSTVETGAKAQAAAAGLPAYAPLYPGAGLVAATRTAVNGTEANAVTMTTTDTPEQVVAFYRGKLEGAGLGQVSEINLGLGRMLVAEDAATGKGVQILAVKTGGQTRIQISQSTAKPKG